MAIKYKVIAKSNPQNREDSKYYVQPIRKGTISKSKIEETIVRETSLSKADVRGVLTTLSDIVADYVTEGYSISLLDIGTLSLRLKSNGSDNESDVTVRNINNVGVSFRPATVLRDKINKAQFEKE